MSTTYYKSLILKAINFIPLIILPITIFVTSVFAAKDLNPKNFDDFKALRVILLIEYVVICCLLVRYMYSSNLKWKVEITVKLIPHLLLILLLFGAILLFFNQIADFMLSAISNKQSFENIFFYISLTTILVKCFMNSITAFYVIVEPNENQKRPTWLTFITLSSIIGQFAYTVGQELYEKNQVREPGLNFAGRFIDSSNYQFIFYPLAIEFCSFCFVELLLSLFNNNHYSDYHIEDDNNDYDRDRIINEENKKPIRASLNLLRLSLAFMILFAVIFCYIIAEYNNVSAHIQDLRNSSISISKIFTQDELNFITASESIELILNVLSLVISFLICFNIIFSRLWSTSGQVLVKLYNHAWIDYCYFILSLLFLCIYTFFELNGLFKVAVDTAHMNQIRRLTEAASFFQFFSGLMQSLAVYMALRCKRNGRFVYLLMVLNLAMWLFNTFSAKEARTNPFLIRWYGTDWAYVDAITIPMSIFFRFHTFVILIKKFLNLY